MLKKHIAQSLEQSKRSLVDASWWSCSLVLTASPGRTTYPPWPFSEIEVAVLPTPQDAGEDLRQVWVGRGPRHVNLWPS